MSRNLLVCLDGTRNEPENGETNVVRLYGVHTPHSPSPACCGTAGLLHPGDANQVAKRPVSVRCGSPGCTVTKCRRQPRPPAPLPHNRLPESEVPVEPGVRLNARICR